MRLRQLSFASFILVAFPAASFAQEPTVPPRQESPILSQQDAAALHIQQTQSLPPQQRETLQEQVEDKIIAREAEETRTIRQYSPLVETYIQDFRADKQLGAVPDGDKYFLGRADFSRGVEVVALNDSRNKKRLLGSMENFLAIGKEYMPGGFLQMVFVDTDGFNRGNYKFTFIRREFLGEVRCLVFDVTPLPKSGKGRFVGRIWVEDQDFHIVRFNGSYGTASLTSYYFSFDSWRVNTGKNLWLPAFIYSQQGDFQDPRTRNMGLKPFKAQTRLWGYSPNGANAEQELTKVMVETPMPVKDQTESSDDYSPLLAARSWDRQAEDNVIDSMEREVLLAPYGNVDKVLETVVNNLEVTNDLNIEPEIRCRVLMTSTLESFTIGHTIVLSRGLIDVLPDEGSLAAIMAHELAHVLLGHRMDAQFGFLNHLRFDEKDTFRHFGFAESPEQEQAANQKGLELLNKSPYKDQTDAARVFLQTLSARAKGIPNLISPHLGDRVPTGWAVASAAPAAEPAAADASAQPAAPKPITVIPALPLGGRVKIDPWSARLQLLRSKPVASVAEYEKMPFEITPFMLYLSRQGSDIPAESPTTVASSAQTDSTPKP